MIKDLTHLRRSTAILIASFCFAASSWFAGESTFAQAHLLAIALTLSGLNAFSLLFRGKGLALLDNAQAVLSVGIFSLSSSSAPVWKTPAHWHEVLRLSGCPVALFILLYLTLFAASLATRDRGLRIYESLCLLLSPYVFGALLALSAPGLPELITSNALYSLVAEASTQRLLGRGAIIFAFNILVIFALSSLVENRPKISWQLFSLCLFSAVICALGPNLANVPSEYLRESNLFLRSLIMVTMSALSQAGLWAETYLITGLLLDALHGRAPLASWGRHHFSLGFFRGAIYAGAFMAVVQAILLTSSCPYLLSPTFIPLWAWGCLIGFVAYPLLKTLAESFDGSAPFSSRLVQNHCSLTNYWRGIPLGLGVALWVEFAVAQADGTMRFLWGGLIGGVTYAVVDLLLDCGEVLRHIRYRLQYAKIYTLRFSLGFLTGGALGWYFEQRQIEALLLKFARYAAAHAQTIEPYIIYPLFSKWGALDLGAEVGGVRLLFNESLSGVVNWSLAAPLFAINLVFLNALLRRSLQPLRDVFSKHGLASVIEQTLRVERWGLWMAPVIYTFLRVAPEPSWYNQDGAVRTIFATYNALTLSDGDFRSWSLNLFVSMLAFDWLRVLIWFDHMGLRVATLVNLSFLGGDLADERAARFSGHSAPTRVFPEGLRRFATWAPLLIPFYLPRGADWDYAWGTAENIAKETTSSALSASAWIAVLGLAVGFLLSLCQFFCRREKSPVLWSWTLEPRRLHNGRYFLYLDSQGRGWSAVRREERPSQEIDLTRRPEDPATLYGKFFYLSEETPSGEDKLWSLHQAPILQKEAKYHCSYINKTRLQFSCDFREIFCQAEVSLSSNQPLEFWQLTISNHSSSRRVIRLTSWRDLVLQESGMTQRHTAFNDIHLSTRVYPSFPAIFAQNRLLLGAAGKRGSKLRRMKTRHPGGEIYFHALGDLAGPVRYLGYQDSKAAFLGFGTERNPCGLHSQLRKPSDQGILYPFEPAAALQVEIVLEAGASAKVSFIEGWAASLEQACVVLGQYHKAAQSLPRHQLSFRRLQETLTQGDPLLESPWSFSPSNGGELQINSPMPRSWTHVLANETEYGCVANDEGALASFAENAQQNALSPFVLNSQSGINPAQALYLYDLTKDDFVFRLPRRLDYQFERREDPALHTTFGKGWVTYRARREDLQLEYSCFVLCDTPAEGRIFKIRNTSNASKTLRLGAYLQFALAELSSDSRFQLQVRWDQKIRAFVAQRPSHNFCRGPAFVAPMFTPEHTTTLRQEFFGRDYDTASPPRLRAINTALEAIDDGFRCAALSKTFSLDAGAEIEFGLILGQGKDLEQVLGIIETHSSAAKLEAALAKTRLYWEQTLTRLTVRTLDTSFDRLVNEWLPYQLLSSRLWGRVGAQQRGGAFGFRDQLQDVIPLAYIRPDLTRKQILLHAAQQFHQGDCLQWWHRTWEGKTGLGARNRASDIHLWLPYVLCSYLKATADRSILDEQVTFLEGPTLQRDTEGVCFAPRPSADSASVYQHCRRAIDFSLRRLGPNGLPLIGIGDWNDGYDALGPDGVGESVWLGFFLSHVLHEFSAVVRTHQSPAEAEALLSRAKALETSLLKMWRGGRFVRATTDSGEELLIDDALSAAWPAISGAVDEQYAQQALSHGLAKLEQESSVLLLHPAFNAEASPYPGRIAHYPPGVRENGGQYSHGSSWMVDALLKLARRADEEGDRAKALELHGAAGRIWHKISPLTHCSHERWQRYGLPPHQQAADIYFGAGHDGRGGWAWYTGSAGRMLCAAWELLGVRIEAGKLKKQEIVGSEDSWPRLRGVDFR